MKSTKSSSRSRRARTAAKVALPWLIACVHAASWADPMRPLLPPNPPSATAAQAPPADRASKTRTADSPREAERPSDRLVAIRQNSASHWQALFGERWVRAGDRLDDYTVASIDGNSVQLTEGRSRRTLYLLPPLLRAGPADVQAPPGSHPPTQLIKSTTLAPAGIAALSPPRSNNGLSPP